MAGTAGNIPRASARSGQYRTLKAAVQPLLRSPTTMLGRRIVNGSSGWERTSCSDSNFDCS